MWFAVYIGRVGNVRRHIVDIGYSNHDDNHSMMSAKNACSVCIVYGVSAIYARVLIHFTDGPSIISLSLSDQSSIRLRCTLNSYANARKEPRKQYIAHIHGQGITTSPQRDIIYICLLFILYTIFFFSFFF